MVIALLMLQIVFAVLQFLAHAITLNLWVVFLPAILVAFLYALAILTKTRLMADAWSFQGMYRPVQVQRRPVQMRHR